MRQSRRQKSHSLWPSPKSLAEDVGEAIARRVKVGSALSVELYDSLTARQARRLRVVLARRGLVLRGLEIEQGHSCLNCYQDGEAPLCEACNQVRSHARPTLGRVTRALRESNWHFDGPTEVGLTLVRGELVHHEGTEAADACICGFEQVPGDGARFDVYAVARRLITAWRDAFS